MTEIPRYQNIANHYEACLEQYGDSHLGVDWPNAADANKRYHTMLDVICRNPRQRPVKLLDVGCGASHLYEFILRENIDDIEYCGLDISRRFVELSRAKFPSNEYWCVDLLREPLANFDRFDYAIMNGLFTEKVDLSFEEMYEFFMAMITKVFSMVDVGLAFNVMSVQVDWERDDLFHLPFDELASWLTREFGRKFIFRSDYGLYEYTTYLYR